VTRRVKRVLIKISLGASIFQKPLSLKPEAWGVAGRQPRRGTSVMLTVLRLLQLHLSLTSISLSNSFIIITTITRRNPRCIKTSVKRSPEEGKAAYPVNHDILSVHPGGLRTRQERNNRRDFINLPNAFQWVRVRNGRDQLLWFSISEQCSIDRT
jgi:hypothetical protein